MRIAVCQTAGRPGDVPGNLSRLEEAARQAAGRGARLLVLPELFLTGYHLGGVGQLAEPADGPSARAAARIARQSGVSLLFGYPERAGDTVYDAALLLDGSGRTVASARKVHLYGPEERQLFRSGRELLLASVEGLRVGLLICYDVEFPEPARALAVAGAELISVPAALPARFAHVPELLVPARACENQLFVAYADRCGEERGVRYAGRSCIVAPDGTVLASAGAGEALLIAEVDPGAYAAARRENPYLEERRPDVYSRPVRTVG